MYDKYISRNCTVTEDNSTSVPLARVLRHTGFGGYGQPVIGDYRAARQMRPRPSLPVLAPHPWRPEGRDRPGSDKLLLALERAVVHVSSMREGVPPAVPGSR
jgi:hypothetical protein